MLWLCSDEALHANAFDLQILGALGGVLAEDGGLDGEHFGFEAGVVRIKDGEVGEAGCVCRKATKQNTKPETP